MGIINLWGGVEGFSHDPPRPPNLPRLTGLPTITLVPLPCLLSPNPRLHSILLLPPAVHQGRKDGRGCWKIYSPPQSRPGR